MFPTTEYVIQSSFLLLLPEKKCSLWRISSPTLRRVLWCNGLKRKKEGWKKINRYGTWRAHRRINQSRREPIIGADEWAQTTEREKSSRTLFRKKDAIKLILYIHNACTPHPNYCSISSLNMSSRKRISPTLKKDLERETWFFKRRACFGNRL